MEDLIEDFKKESQGIVVQCTKALDEAEEIENRDEILKFANLIDRIMGGAQTLDGVIAGQNPGIKCIAQLSQLCKVIGYRSRHVTDPALYDVIVAFLEDATEIVENILDEIETVTSEDVKANFSDHVVKRLNLVAQKLPADGPLLPEEKKVSKQDMQAMIDQMLNFEDGGDDSGDA